MIDNREQIDVWRFLLGVTRYTRPLLGRLGIKIDSAALDEMIDTLDTSTAIRDSFNDLFADRGWIAHDWVNLEIAAKALEAGQQGRLEEADELMVSAYDADTIRLWLYRMLSLKCFRRRYSLALLAVEDYAEGRYHACVPVTLALFDGMGQELTGAGFLRQGVRFATEESFLEIGPGLTTLVKTMTQSRGRTSDDEIFVPHRHGILHGVDLGYANKVVAAKAWGAIIAAGSYATRVEAPLAKSPQVGLVDSMRQIVETRRRTRKILAAAEEWQPRETTSLITQLEVESPQLGTPEKAVGDFLHAWQKSNFGATAQLSLDSTKAKVSTLAGRLRRLLPVPPATYEFVAIDDESSALAVVRLVLTWSDGWSEEVELRVLCRDDDGAAPRNLAGVRWLIVSLWPLEAIALQQKAQEDRDE